ncbi:hypothetical protein OIU77_015444 [Salix suchowensis]|uniref:Uncharacterized protein n=1 Tax=Salix suchowensis TaxID=1278906 RepID=A0ABQ8ZH88_9ROSI|nr:hypothetical protein OIU77_015444 [Salix suchowensis]
MKPNLLTADSFLIFNSLTLLSRNSIPFPRNRIPHPNHFLSIVTHPNSAKPSRLLPICSSTNPTRKQLNPANEESLNSNVEALGGDELEKNFNVQVANPIVPSFIQSWTKLSLSDHGFGCIFPCPFGREEKGRRWVQRRRERRETCREEGRDVQR